jgi:hypothetical protein
MSSGAAPRRSSSAATAKRPAVAAAESAGVGAKAAQANKRAALGDVSNVAKGGAGTGGRAGGSRKASAAPAGTAASVHLCASRLFSGWIECVCVASVLVRRITDDPEMWSWMFVSVLL